MLTVKVDFHPLFYVKMAFNHAVSPPRRNMPWKWGWCHSTRERLPYGLGKFLFSFFFLFLCYGGSKWEEGEKRGFFNHIVVMQTWCGNKTNMNRKISSRRIDWYHRFYQRDFYPPLKVHLKMVKNHIFSNFSNSNDCISGTIWAISILKKDFERARRDAYSPAWDFSFISIPYPVKIDLNDFFP